MIIAGKIKQRIDTFPLGKVFTIADFDVERNYCGALVKSLNRMANQGLLLRLSKGKYYKPQQSVFGTLPPSETEVVKDFLERDGKTIGYITGTVAFASMGLTTQISSNIVIGTNKYRRPLARGQYQISFLLQPNPINKKDIELYRLLDALKLIRQIPASAPDAIVQLIGKRIAFLDTALQKRLLKLVEKYAPFVRALLGAIMEQVDIEADSLKSSLNGVTTYNIGISPKALPTITNWNIR